MDYKELYQQHIQGKSVSQIALENGINQNTIGRNFKKLGLINTRSTCKLSERLLFDAFYYALGYGTKASAEKFNISDRSISQFMRKKELKFPNYPPLKRENTVDSNYKDIIDKIAKGVKTADIAKEYGVHPESINKVLRVRNISRDLRHKEVNDFFFEKIETEIQSYILGFLYADGCINKDNRINFLISAIDRYIVEVIKDYICPLHEISYSGKKDSIINRKPQVNLRFKSKVMVEDLKKLEVYCNKTYNPGDPFKYIPDFHKRHFIRGFLDGDGHIRKIGRSVQLCNTSLPLFQSMYSFLNENDIKSTLKHTVTNKGVPFYHLSIYGTEVTKFVNLLYTNYTFALPRKEAVALKCR